MRRFLIFLVIFNLYLQANIVSLGKYKSYKKAKKILNKYPNAKIIMIEDEKSKKFLYKVFTEQSNTVKERKIIKPKKENIDIAHDNDEFIIYDDTIISDEIIDDTIKVKNEVPKIINDTNTTKKRVFTIKQTPKEEIIDLANESNQKVEQIVKTNTNLTKSEGIVLKKAILTALKKSNKIMSLREKVIQAKRVVDEKNAAFKPKIDFMANSNRIKVTPKDANTTKYKKDDYMITFKENIYQGGKSTSELKREENNLKIAEAKFKDKVEEEITNIIDAYFALIYQTKSINISEKNMKNLQKILDIVKLKEKNGAASKGDLNYIKSQLENAKSELIKQQSIYKNAISLYEYYVGKDKSLMPKQEEPSFKKYKKGDILNIFYHNNSKILIAKYKIQAQKQDVKAIRANFKPSIDFTIRDKGKVTNSDAEPGEKRTTAFLTFNYNIYNGGKDKAKILKSKSKILELKYKLVDLKESMKFNLKQIYESTKSSEDSMIHTKKEVDANKKVIDSYWNAFKYGNQDIQALLLAQRALNRSELDLIKEKQKYTTNYFKLLQVSGILLKELGVESFINANEMVQNDSIF